MAEVELSFGKFRLVEPSFAGWESVLSVLPASEYDLVRQIIAILWRESEPTANAEAAGLALPLLHRLPMVAAAFVAACLREQDGKPVEPERVYREAEAASDLVKILAGLVEHGILERVAWTGKNLLGLVRPADKGQAPSQG